MADEKLDLDAIEARANAATPGPWTDIAYSVSEGQTSCFVGVATAAGETWNVEADRQFMAAARSDVPALLAEVRRLRALVDALAPKHPEGRATRIMPTHFEAHHAEPCEECGYSLNEIRDYVHELLALRKLRDVLHDVWKVMDSAVTLSGDPPSKDLLAIFKSAGLVDDKLEWIGSPSSAEQKKEA